MALGTFAPGPYTATYNSNDVGIVEGPRRVQRSLEMGDMRGDEYGQSVIDGVYQGGQVFVMMTFKEWTANIKSAIWPFDSDFGDMGVIGRIASNIASALVLTPVASTPAAGESNTTLTFNLALLAGGFNVDIPLGADRS